MLEGFYFLLIGLSLTLFPILVLVQVPLDQYQTGAQDRDVIDLTDQRQHIRHQVEGIEDVDQGEDD